MRAPQGGSAAGRAVADVPGTIVAAKQTKAQATARELIIIFVNVVFIVVVSFCLSLLCWPSLIPIMGVISGRSLRYRRKPARGYGGNGSRMLNRNCGKRCRLTVDPVHDVDLTG